MSRDFTQKSVLITGAGSGIGRETAFCFAEAGAKLELTDIEPAGLERTALLCEKLGAEVHTHIADVASAEAMREVAERVHARVRALDVLINNAGVGVAGSFLGTDLATWDWAIGVNLKGVVHGCHFFLPKMIERGEGGHVLNVASVAGLVASKVLPVYCATKFAVVGFSEALRAELKPHGISVTTLCPGVVNTPITRNTRRSGNLAHDTGFNERAEKLYLRRNYGPERVAAAAIDAVRKRKGLVPVTPESWLMYYGKRLAPQWMEGVMGRDVRV